MVQARLLPVEAPRRVRRAHAFRLLPVADHLGARVRGGVSLALRFGPIAASAGGEMKASRNGYVLLLRSRAKRLELDSCQVRYGGSMLREKRVLRLAGGLE